jgi:hypothetical protein
MEMRDRLLKDLPVTERRLDLTGVFTSLLEGGDGPPIVLLHGQGGFAEMWGQVIRQENVVSETMQPVHLGLWLRPDWEAKRGGGEPRG